MAEPACKANQSIFICRVLNHTHRRFRVLAQISRENREIKNLKVKEEEGSVKEEGIQRVREKELNR